MVRSRVMTAAAVQSHHSRRSMRRKFARGSFDCPNPGCLTVFGRGKNHHAESTLFATPIVSVPALADLWRR